MATDRYVLLTRTPSAAGASTPWCLGWRVVLIRQSPATKSDVSRETPVRVGVYIRWLLPEVEAEATGGSRQPEIHDGPTKGTLGEGAVNRSAPVRPAPQSRSGPPNIVTQREEHWCMACATAAAHVTAVSQTA